MDKYEEFKKWLSNSTYTFIEITEMELIFEGQVFEHFEDYLEEQKDLIKWLTYTNRVPTNSIKRKQSTSLLKTSKP